MRFVKTILFAGSLMLGLVANANADFYIFANDGNNILQLSSWTGASATLDGYTFQVVANNDNVGQGIFTVKVTGDATTNGQDLNFNFKNNTALTSFGTLPAYSSAYLTAISSGDSGLKTPSGSITFAAKYTQVNTGSYTSVALGSPDVNLTTAGFDPGFSSGQSSGYKLAAFGDVTFGAAGGIANITSEVLTKTVPEPMSMMIALTGIPCMGGLVRLARRKA